MIRDTDRALIRGRRRPSGARVHVDAEPLAPATQFWEASLCLRNHSPAGPEWGYAGCGAAQLALTVLLLVTDSVEAERHYQVFKQSVIAGIRGDRWTFPVTAGTWSASSSGATHAALSFVRSPLETQPASSRSSRPRSRTRRSPSPRFASSSTSW